MTVQSRFSLSLLPSLPLPPPLPTPNVLVAVLLSLALTLSGAAPVHAQSDEQRWYQIELSIFVHENSNPGQEHWPPERVLTEFPDNARVLTSQMDILDLPDWDWLSQPVHFDNPLPSRQNNVRLPDAERDAYVELPSSAHNFSDTNRALATSPNYRLLFHSAWRQPLQVTSQAQPLLVAAGRQFGDRYELEGSLIVGFNPGRDRVILETDLWWTQFTTRAPEGPGLTLLTLPALPTALQPVDPAAAQSTADDGSQPPAPSPAVAPLSGARNDTSPVYYPSSITPVRSQRAMRSREFHYLDHPAVGIVVQVLPYTPPAAPGAAAWPDSDAEAR